MAPVVLTRSVLAMILCRGAVIASPLTISDVPAYNWYHGCGPTAVGSVIGYWDLHGYPDLFDASGDEVFRTVRVRDQISSPAHNAKYDPTPDDAVLPAPPTTSIADFFQTSEGFLEYGWSYQSFTDDAFVGYAAYRGYRFASSYVAYSGLLWDGVVDEINAGRPMVFLVDTDGNGSTDHFVPVIGYDDRGDGKWYGIYTTWSEDETVVWERYRGMQSGNQWGIGYATFADPLDAPTPEPSTLWLAALGSGLIGIGLRRHRAGG
jgi:hypothetical protein